MSLLIFDLPSLRHVCSHAFKKGGSLARELGAAMFIESQGRKKALENRLPFSQWKRENYDLFQSLLSPLEQLLAKDEGYTFCEYFERFLAVQDSSGGSLPHKPVTTTGFLLNRAKPRFADPVLPEPDIGPSPILCRIVRSEEGLSWMEVSFCDLVSLGIAEKISRLSLYHDGNVYLSPVDQYFLETAAEDSDVKLHVMDPEDLYRNVPGYPSMDGKKTDYPDTSALPPYVLEKIQGITNDDSERTPEN